MLRRIMLAVAVLSLFCLAPAAAHTDLVSSSPQDGQTLAQAPAEIALTFGEDLLAGGDRLVAKDAAGAAVNLTPRVKGPVLSADWPKDAATGTFTISYRAVAADGHPLEGRVTFTVKAPAQQSPSDAPSPVAAPSGDDEPSANAWLIAGPLVLVAALATAGFFVWRSRE